MCGYRHRCGGAHLYHCPDCVAAPLCATAEGGIACLAFGLREIYRFCARDCDGFVGVVVSGLGSVPADANGAIQAHCRSYWLWFLRVQGPIGAVVL
jgi:hypothetical protein